LLGLSEEKIAELTDYARDDQDSLLIAPLAYHRTSGSSSDTVVFPLYWRFHRKDMDATVVTGLYWDFQWPEENKRLQVAPGYLRWDRPGETTHIAGPVSWSTGKGAQRGSWSFHMVPLVSMWRYHPDHFKWRALFWAFGHEREYNRHQYTVFWYKTDVNGG
jgi:hypothetical protein